MKKFAAWLLGFAASLSMLGFSLELLAWAWSPTLRNLRGCGTFLLLAAVAYGFRQELKKDS